MFLIAKDDENYAQSIRSSFDNHHGLSRGHHGGTAQPPDAATRRVRVGTYVKTTLYFHTLPDILSTMQYKGGTLSHSTCQLG